MDGSSSDSDDYHDTNNSIDLAKGRRSTNRTAGSLALTAGGLVLTAGSFAFNQYKSLRSSESKENILLEENEQAETKPKIEDFVKFLENQEKDN